MEDGLTLKPLLTAAAKAGYWLYIDHERHQIYSGQDVELAIENLMTLNECAITLQKRGVPSVRIVFTRISRRKFDVSIITDGHSDWMEKWMRSNVRGYK